MDDAGVAPPPADEDSGAAQDAGGSSAAVDDGSTSYAAGSGGAEAGAGGQAAAGSPAQLCAEGETQACDNAGMGVCSKGSKTCLGGQWTGCRSATARSSERCDGLDNDCDGVVDNASACSGGTRCVSTSQGYRCVDCLSDAECGSNHCVNNRCAECASAQDCPDPGDCKQRACSAAGVCEPKAAPSTTTCQGAQAAPGVCRAGSCSVRIVALQSRAGAGDIETADGKWVVASCGSDGRSLCASATSAASAARFALVSNTEDGSVSLWSFSARRYVSIAVDAGEDTHLRAVADWNQDWERFFPGEDASGYFLESKQNGNYVGAQDVASAFILLSSASVLGPWEHFRLVDCPGGSCE